MKTLISLFGIASISFCSCGTIISCSNDNSNNKADKFSRYEQYIEDYYVNAPLNEISSLVFKFVPQSRTKYSDLIGLAKVNSVSLQSITNANLIYNVNLALVFSRHPELNLQFKINIDKFDYLISYPSYESVKVPGQGKDLIWTNYIELNNFKVLKSWVNDFFNGPSLINIIWDKQYYRKNSIQVSKGPLVHNYFYSTVQIFLAIGGTADSPFYDSLTFITLVENKPNLNYPAIIPTLIHK